MVREEEPDSIEYDSMEEYLAASGDPLHREDRRSEWNENPEPEVGRPDGQTITENKQNQDHAYVWHAKKKDAWIRFEGDTMDIEA